MLKKIFDLVTGKRGRTKRLAATLDDFLTNAKNNSLTVEEARKNLEEGVVELVKYGEHSSNGLLISDDGYFLTARHCVERSLPQQIVLYDGMKCRVEKVCAKGKTDLVDIALVKADVPGNAVSRSYRLQTSEYVDACLPIALFTRWDEKLVKKYGFTGPAPSSWKDSFVSSIPVIHGDSGGIVANQDYNLMGIISCFRCLPTKTSQPKRRYDLHSTISVSMPKALNLINFYKRRLESYL